MSLHLSVENLRISFRNEKGEIPAVDGLSFSLERGETLALVGESGAGKSTTALALLGFRQTGAGISLSGSMNYYPRESEAIPLHELPEKAWRELRGREIGMIFQNPARALNPVLRCGEQLAETIRRHESLRGKAADERLRQLLEQVQLPAEERLLQAWPHRLSGGQQQRFMIALALAGRPSLLIADEPTSALDRSTEDEIIKLLESLQKKLGLSMLFITHDMDLVRRLAGRVIVLQRGRCVEEGPVREVFSRPQSPYTALLMASRPPARKKLHRLPEFKDVKNLFEKSGGQWPEGGMEKLHDMPGLSPNAVRSQKHTSKAIFRIEDLSISYGEGKGKLSVVKQFEASWPAGSTLGLMGPSGSGKSSIAKALLRLIPVESGRFFYGERDLLALPQKTWQKECHKYQMIFQDPYSALNPRHSIAEALTRPLLYHRLAASPQEALEKAAEMLEEVGLEAGHLQRLPRAFSGGQRQRIAIARALLMQPDLLICDECVSALDPGVQARVLNLIKTLQEKYGFACLFISHDEGVVRFMADGVCVL